MHIICDKHIPFLAEAIRRYWPEAHISPIEPEEINSTSVRNADVLVVRTRTQVDAKLLGGSSVQLVCSATIGYDHIDSHYCNSNGIQWMSCPGCNAKAVCDYIEEAIDEFTDGTISKRFPETIGIVGVGHVGVLVAEMARQKGFQVLVNDSPKGIGVSLDEIAERCDIITFHVPLKNASKPWPTFHLCDSDFLSHCSPNALIINASRGGVVDENALLLSGHPYILDTWENEPAIQSEVVRHAFRASMHIAGYSIEGKRNATIMCLDAIRKKFNLPEIPFSAINNLPSPKKGDSSPGWLARITELLKSNPSSFEQLRKEYALR